MRTDLAIQCDQCDRPAYYLAVPSNPEADTLYRCAHHAYPLSAFAHLPVPRY